MNWQEPSPEDLPENKLGGHFKRGVHTMGWTSSQPPCNWYLHSIKLEKNCYISLWDQLKTEQMFIEWRKLLFEVGVKQATFVKRKVGKKMYMLMYLNRVSWKVTFNIGLIPSVAVAATKQFFSNKSKYFFKSCELVYHSLNSVFFKSESVDIFLLTDRYKDH